MVRGRPISVRRRRGHGWLAATCLAAAAALAALSAFWWVRGDEALGVGAAAASALFCAVAALLAAPLVVSLVGKRTADWTPPLTKPGLGYIVLTLLVAAAAVYSGSNLVYLVLSAMLAAMLVSGLISRLDLSGLQLRLALPTHLFATQPALARIAVKNLKRWLPSFAIRVCVADPGRGFELEDLYFPYLPAGEELTASSQASFARRGRYREGQVALETRFPFGFVMRRVKLRLTEEILVYPSVEVGAEARRVLDRMRSRALGRTRGDSHDLYRVRPAAHGDSARFVHWKATARSGELWVREFARDDERRMRLLFDRRLPAGTDADWFEEQVAVCAAVAWRLHQSGAEVTLVSDERILTCRPDGAEIFDLLAYLALVRASSPQDAPPLHSRDSEAAEHRFSLTAAREPEPAHADDAVS